MNRDDENTRTPAEHEDDEKQESCSEAAAESRDEAIDEQSEAARQADKQEETAAHEAETAGETEAPEEPETAAHEPEAAGEPETAAHEAETADKPETPDEPGRASETQAAGEAEAPEAPETAAGETEAPEEPEAPDVTWEDLGLDPGRAEKLRALGYVQPMEVQVATYQMLAEGRDIMVQSRTGSGKTAAFGVPLVERLREAEDRHPQVLALMPTRELAIQVADEIARIAEGTGVNVCALYGGAAISPQIRKLEQGVQMVCGTPGRVLDHIRRRSLKVDAIDTLVLDEADEMLSMGFYEELSSIISRLPNRKQTLLFSATIPDEVRRLANKYLQEPERLILSDDFIGVREIQHVYYMISGLARSRDLMRVLEEEQVESAIIFCNTREETANLAGYLQDAGLPAEAISSDFSQPERERAMARMREGRTRFLVATDIAARGIDIAELSHVINYRFPENADIYIHRTGRTGRAGKSGVAISLVSPQELGDFYYMKLTHGIAPEERFLPTPAELAARREGERYAALATRIDELDESVDPEFLALTRRIWHSLRGEEIVAYLLQEHFARPRRASARPSRRRALQAASLSRRAECDTDAPADPRNRRRARGRDDRRRSEGDRNERQRRGARASDRGRRGTSRGERGGRRETSRRERGDRREDRDQRTRNVGPRSEEGTKLYLNIGRNGGVKPSTLIQFLVENAGIDRQQVYRIQIRDRFSFVGVDPSTAQAVVEAANGKPLGDQTVKVELARATRQ